MKDIASATAAQARAQETYLDAAAKSNKKALDGMAEGSQLRSIGAIEIPAVTPELKKPDEEHTVKQEIQDLAKVSVSPQENFPLAAPVVIAFPATK